MIRAFMSGDMQEIIMTVGVYLIIIFLVTPIHECAHAWTAVKMGDDTPRLQGRLTLNPFAHMDPVGTAALVLVGFGWGKPVQVNPLRFKKYRKGIALTALAGPVSNLIVAFLGICGAKFAFYASVAKLSDGLYMLYQVLNIFTSVNIGLAVFNLIPIPPLDGQKILAYFTSKKFDQFVYQNPMFMTLLLFAILSSGLPTKLSGLMLIGFNKLTFFVDIIAKAVYGLS